MNNNGNKKSNNVGVTNPNLDIFIYSHIPFRPVVTNPCYKILTCSHDAFPRTPLKLIRDYNYPESLSKDNLMWNEYSGIHALAYDPKIYLKDYVGFCHYRRYFYFMDNIFSMNTMFDNFDIVLGEPVYFHKVLNCKEDDYDVASQYGYYHNIKDLLLMADIIKEIHPDMSETVDKVLYENNYLYNSFMSIWKQEDFLDYADFCFPILFEVCKRRNCFTTEDWIKYVTEHRDEYNKPFNSYYSDPKIGGRVIGYLAERLCNIYLHHKWDNGYSLVDKAAVIPWSMIPESQYKV